jgi:hypothetical protein
MIQKTQKNYERLWEELYREITLVLDKYGSSYNFRAGEGDYWIIDEPYGFDQHNVYFCNFKLFEPNIIKELQGLLKKFSGWEIFVTVLIEPEGKDWPNMGLIIREHEIVDGLQRQYFPSEYRSIQYEGSRAGTDKD